MRSGWAWDIDQLIALTQHVIQIRAPYICGVIIGPPTCLGTPFASGILRLFTEYAAYPRVASCHFAPSLGRTGGVVVIFLLVSA